MDDVQTVAWQEFALRVMTGQPIWPNQWPQEIAAVAFMLEGPGCRNDALAKRVRELEERSQFFSAEVGYLNIMLGAADSLVESLLPALAGDDLEQVNRFREDVHEALHGPTDDAAMQQDGSG